jgi:hypothetical protein
MELLLVAMATNGDEDSGDFVELVELRAFLASCRKLDPIQRVPKTDAMHTMLFAYPDADFKQIVRMDKQSFVQLAALLEIHPVFRNASKNKQYYPWIQLMVVFSRLGCDGNGASIGRNARSFGVSYGTVCQFTVRVFSAVLSLLESEIKWPNATEREETSRRFRDNYGLPGAVGIVDGTPVVLMQRPHIDGEVFRTRKCHLSA